MDGDPEAAADFAVGRAALEMVLHRILPLQLGAEPCGAMAVAAGGHRGGQRRSRARTFGGGIAAAHHRIVRDVMRPRQEITALDTQASIAECISIAEKTRYSRFPLCEGGDLDKTPGVVHIKDLYAT